MKASPSIAWVFAAWLVGSAAPSPATAAENRFAAPGHDRPNVLMLFADDLTYRALGVSGNPDVKTPNIDRLAARGVTFTRASIQGGLSGAVCVASRAMLFTGRSLWRCGKQGDCAREDGTLYPLWGQTLGAAGYRTFAVGKWHNGKRPLEAAFQTPRPVNMGGMLVSTPVDGPAYHRPAPGNPWTPDDPKWKGHWLERDGKPVHSSVLWADAAIDHLNDAARGDRPFFLYVAFNAPHDPRQSPREYLDRYDPGALEFPPNFLPRHPFNVDGFQGRDAVLAPYPRTEPVVRTHMKEYYSIISHLDAQVGRILEALGRSGKADNTIVVFAADNGLAVGQHGLLGKQSLYDHSVHVPLIVAGPGVPKGKTVQALAYLPGLFATTCEMAGVKRPDTVEFPSLVPLITGEKATLHDDLYAGYVNRQRMVRTERWKLVVTVPPADPMVQLFDLEADPWEQHNLADDPGHRSTLDDLIPSLRRWMNETGDPMPVAKVDAVLAAHLKPR